MDSIRTIFSFYYSLDICAQLEQSQNVIGVVVIKRRILKNYGLKSSKKPTGGFVIDMSVKKSVRKKISLKKF